MARNFVPRIRLSIRSMGPVAAVAAALLTAAPAAPTLAAEAEAEEAEEAEVQTREVVDLTLKIAAEGRAVGSIAQRLELDTDTALALQADGHEHAVAITVRKAADDGARLAVTLGYRIDGEEVVETKTIEAAAKKATIVRSDGGKVSLSLELSPATVSEQAPKRPRVDFAEDTNDPLAGL